MPDDSRVLNVSASFPLPADPFAAAPILTKTGDAVKAAEAAISDALGTPFKFDVEIVKAKKPREPRKTKAEKAAEASAAAAAPPAPPPAQAKS